MQTIQQQLANRLYELLPHKKELEFGCWILDRKDNIQKRIAGSNGEEKVLIKGIGEMEKYKLLDICDFEIIGQPIRLADVLMAIKKANHYVYIESGTTDNYIELRVTGYGNSTFDLSKDNILNQSNELCEFALDLLK